MPFDEETESRLLGNDPALTSLDLQSTQVSEQTLERLTLARRTHRVLVGTFVPLIR
jgi:hypothetical protein